MRILLFIGIFLGVLTTGFGQSEQLARNFFDQGEYEKALKTYENLAEENPGNMNIFLGRVSSHQQLEEFDKAEELLRKKLDNTANRPSLLIEIGHNFALQDKDGRAREFYREALAAIEGRPNYAGILGRVFQKYNLLDEAAQAYEKGMELQNDRNYNLQLARIYGEQGNLEKMFESYLGLIDKNPDFFGVANREFGRYITEDGNNEANQMLRKLLLKRLQQNPRILYNEMLSWLFIQQEELDKAFAQEKAIYRRGEGNIQKLLNLAALASNTGDNTAAREIVAYVIEEAPSENIVLNGKRFLLNIDAENAREEDSSEIVSEYEALLSEFGRDLKTLQLQLDFAEFLAFRMGERQRAISQLKELSEKAKTDRDIARTKMLLADVLVLEEKFNQALIYYTQIQNLVKNNAMSQEARFKVAKTSYYKGDFKWAKKQLDVLKSSTSQLIANDAMELSLLIEDNSIEDTTQTALKLYAKADLLAFQEKDKEAVILLEEIKNKYSGEEIEDEVLLKQAQLYELLGNFEQAEVNYLQIIDKFNDDILADNANFYLAELYANQLENEEKAMDYYEQIIFNFADSIYFVEARKKYRLLRGDNME